MSSISVLDEETWTTMKLEYKRRVASIIIPLDISPGVAKGLLSRIDAFCSETILEAGELEGQKETVSSIITEWERTKISGTNDLERKKNASRALQEYPTGPDSTMNMYEVQRVILDRHAFLKAVIKSLEGKQSRLITLTGLLKLEKDLSPYGAIE
jgi:hypothetical protein